MPAVGGVASVLGIKCVNLFPCACVHCFGRGIIMCNWTRTPTEWKELFASVEVADLRFVLLVFYIKRKKMSWNKRCQTILNLSSLRWAEFWLFWRHVLLVTGAFGPILFYFSVKLNVWRKLTLTSYIWLPVRYAVFA